MKVLKHRNLLGCLFAVILAMPLINIGVRCAYTIFNKNAKDSYSGTYDISYKYQSNSVNNDNDLIIGNIYHFVTGTEHELLDLVDNGYLEVKIIKLNYFYFDNITNSYLDEVLFYDDSEIVYETNLVFSNGVIGCYTPSENNYLYANIEYNGSVYIDMIVQYKYSDNLWNNHVIDYFTYTDYNEVENFDTSGTLDNAFDYSISKITESNNIGELKFFTWFADLFLDLDNSSNALYINFINWYFNYALLVSAVYILFLALMWFIQWVRRLLERGMDFGNRSW